MKKQIKTRLSRILCTALALCMIIALVPSAFAETTEEMKEFTIDFEKDVSTTDDLFNTTNNAAGWAFSAGYIATADLQDVAVKNRANYVEDKTTYAAIKAKAENEYYAINFKPPKSGTYKITYDYYQIHSNNLPSGGVGDVYILDEGVTVTEAIRGEGGTKIFEGIIYGAKSNLAQTAPENPEYTFEDDKVYTIAFVTTGPFETSTNCRMYPTSLTFTKQTEPGITINYNIEDIITANPQANFGKGGVAFSDLFNYEETNGFFNFVTASRENTGKSSSFCCYGNFIQFADNIESHIVFELNVPVEGEYSIKVDTRSNFTDTVNVFLSQNTTDYMNKDFLIGTYAGIAGSASTVDVLTAEGTVWKEKLNAGKYNIAFTGKKSGDKGGSLGNLYLYTGGGEGEDPVYMGALVKADKTVVNIGKKANLEVIACMSDGNPADTTVEWKSDNEDVAKVEDGVVTAISSGVAKISAFVTYNGVPETVTKVITVNDADLSAAFSDGVTKTENSETVGKTATINILTHSTDGTPQTYVDTIQADYNKLTSIPAPNLGDDYTFLYWAKGATDSKQIIPGETVEIYPTVEATYLIAVYEPISDTTGNKVEFYNYNGQLLGSEFTQDDKMPALPSMTGYGKADHWALYGSTDTYKPGDDASAFATGTHIFVAQYNDLDEDITVTAENCTVNGESSATVKYGDTVECVATGDGDKKFKWWTKTVGDNPEIVSLNEKYIFKAWEDCTVTAVYDDKAPTYVGDKMRIILATLDVEGETAYMAEFVGLERAVEKGIMLGTKKIAMSSNDNQFTVINDIENISETDIKGYAILANGTLITDK